MTHYVAAAVAAAVAAVAAAVAVAIVESCRGWLGLLCCCWLWDLGFHWGCSWRSKLYRFTLNPLKRKSTSTQVSPLVSSVIMTYVN